MVCTKDGFLCETCPEWDTEEMFCTIFQEPLKGDEDGYLVPTERCEQLLGSFWFPGKWRPDKIDRLAAEHVTPCEEASYVPGLPNVLGYGSPKAWEPKEPLVRLNLWELI
jgi:hypothetical protein